MPVTRSPSRPPSGSPAYSPDNLPAYRGGSSAAAPAVTLIYDSFTEASTVDLSAHTPDTVVSPASGGWTAAVNHFQVGVSNFLAGGSVIVVNRMCHISGGISDGIVSAGSVGTAAALMFRRTDDSNHWLLFNRASGATNVELYEITGGTLTTRGTYNVGSYAARKLQVILNGTSIACYIDGVLRISHTSSSHQSATGYGFRADAGVAFGGLCADEFRVIDSTNAADLP